MRQKFVRRYLILIAVLVICAGVVWFMSNTTKVPAEDAVLASVPGCSVENGITGGKGADIPEADNTAREGSYGA